MQKLYQNKRVPRVFGKVMALLFVGYVQSACLCRQVFAQGDPGDMPLLTDFGDLFRFARGIALPVAVAIGVILVIINGYKIMTSEGDPQKVQDGKEGLTSAIIGLIFVLLAGTLLRLILGSLLDVN